MIALLAAPIISSAEDTVNTTDCGQVDPYGTKKFNDDCIADSR